jgi:hypothetical protein
MTRALVLWGALLAGCAGGQHVEAVSEEPERIGEARFVNPGKPTQEPASQRYVACDRGAWGGGYNIFPTEYPGGSCGPLKARLNMVLYPFEPDPECELTREQWFDRICSLHRSVSCTENNLVSVTTMNLALDPEFGLGEGTIDLAMANLDGDKCTSRYQVKLGRAR